MTTETPVMGSMWRHKSGTLYVVADLTNMGSERADYPPTVVYFDQATGKRWSRPVSEWSRSMTMPDKELPPLPDVNTSERDFWCHTTMEMHACARQAVAEALAGREGWKLVPVKPTIEMHNAAALAPGICGTPPYLTADGRIGYALADASEVYAAMLAAAPEFNGVKT